MTDIFTIAASLAACLCAEVTDDDGDSLCFCGVMAGDQAYDFAGLGDCEDGKCGQAWVRVVTVYPMSVLGQANVETRNCDVGLGADLEVGLLRCWPIEEDGEAVDPLTMLEVAQQQLLDEESLRRAVSCCEELKDYILGQWTPVGPEGGLIGGTYTVYVGT